MRTLAAAIWETFHLKTPKSPKEILGITNHANFTYQQIFIFFFNLYGHLAQKKTILKWRNYQGPKLAVQIALTTFYPLPENEELEMSGITYTSLTTRWSNTSSVL